MNNFLFFLSGLTLSEILIKISFFFHPLRNSCNIVVEIASPLPEIHVLARDDDGRVMRDVGVRPLRHTDGIPMFSGVRETRQSVAIQNCNFVFVYPANDPHRRDVEYHDVEEGSAKQESDIMHRLWHEPTYRVCQTPEHMVYVRNLSKVHLRWPPLPGMVFTGGRIVQGDGVVSPFWLAIRRPCLRDVEMTDTEARQQLSAKMNIFEVFSEEHLHGSVVNHFDEHPMYAFVASSPLGTPHGTLENVPWYFGRLTHALKDRYALPPTRASMLSSVLRSFLSLPLPSPAPAAAVQTVLEPVE